MVDCRALLALFSGSLNGDGDQLKALKEAFEKRRTLTRKVNLLFVGNACF